MISCVFSLLLSRMGRQEKTNTQYNRLLQDFALDPEEMRMRHAAHHMVRFMTSGMALITCREPLLVNIANNIKTAFINTLRVGEHSTTTT